MAVDYTVIVAVRQRFGDATYSFETSDEQELEAPHIGFAKEFAFSCPSVDPGQIAVLHFESFGVSTSDNLLYVNGVPVPGGIKRGTLTGVDITERSSRSFGFSFWKAHSLLVEANVLKEENTLYIESVKLRDTDTLDNFIIDNVVIFFKTRT
jgi:hypothetical protein